MSERREANRAMKVDYLILSRRAVERQHDGFCVPSSAPFPGC